MLVRYIAIMKLKKLRRELKNLLPLYQKDDDIVLEVLCNQIIRLDNLVEMLYNGQLKIKITEEKKLFGILRPIAEFDSLSANRLIYNLATDAENYLSNHFTQ